MFIKDFYFSNFIDIPRIVSLFCLITIKLHCDKDSIDEIASKGNSCLPEDVLIIAFIRHSNLYHNNKDEVDNLVPIGFDSENLNHPCCYDC